ncbi:MAG: cytochrome c biogenesis protein CcdA [Verrucomicrobiota bacterium]
MMLALLLPLSAAVGLEARAQASTPFAASAFLEPRGTAAVVRVVLEMPAGHHIYADAFKVQAGDGVALAPSSIPAPQVEFDKFSEETRPIYKGKVEFLYEAPAGARQVSLTVGFQGCSEKLCYFPEKRKFELSLDPAQGRPAESAAQGSGASGAAAWQELAGFFSVGALDTGYLDKQAFLEFLDRGVGGHGSAASGLPSAKLGLLATLFGILLGGIGLNLTPCVLPLIPINLAIIGAGARAGSRKRGFLLGGAYGLGMATVYGLLGLVVVITGSKFGALNSSPWFNLTIAVVFFVLALAMFDVIRIDLTRFQGRSGAAAGGPGKGRYVAAFVLGAVAALLAGACVAPVVISVLVLAGNLYSKGDAVGLLLPFLLGFGMALPWPFAGAGLSFLPKPGKWMTWVKYGFGVVILVLATYYGHLAYGLFSVRGGWGAGGSAAAGEGGGAPASSDRALADGLRRARDEGKPVFIDFWATWCKNCLVMEKTTFKDPEVQARLKEFVTVRYDAESPNESPAREALDRFGAIGLPTYVVLVPKSSP